MGWAAEWGIWALFLGDWTTRATRNVILGFLAFILEVVIPSGITTHSIPKVSGRFRQFSQFLVNLLHELALSIFVENRGNRPNYAASRRATSS